jgi:hypothetical protein
MIKSGVTVTDLPPDGPQGVRVEIVLLAADVAELNLDWADRRYLDEYQRAERGISDLLRALELIFRRAAQHRQGGFGDVHHQS